LSKPSPVVLALARARRAQIGTGLVTGQPVGFDRFGKLTPFRPPLPLTGFKELYAGR
jgi:hypothetical protein